MPFVLALLLFSAAFCEAGTQSCDPSTLGPEACISVESSDARIADDSEQDTKEATSMKTSLLQMKHSKSGQRTQNTSTLQARRKEILAELAALDTRMNDTFEAVRSAQLDDAPVGTCASYGCASGYNKSRSCQCNALCRRFDNCCEDYESMCTDAGLSDCRGAYSSNNKPDAPCLCVFDIDRTLTGKQAALDRCPRNQQAEPTIWDHAYGFGKLSLSPFSVEGIDKTFCSNCYTGVVSAGTGSNDQERALITDQILSTEKMKELVKTEPSARQWTRGYIRRGGSVHSPFVRNQADRKKQYAVRAVQKWYDSKSICIPDFAVHFFGDRTENMPLFGEYPGFNAREISCGSRDDSIGNGMVGLCGAKPEEIVDERGIFICADGSQA